VDEAGKTMDEIVTSVKRVTDIMSEIAAASQEQSAGIEQVNQPSPRWTRPPAERGAGGRSLRRRRSMEEQAQALTASVSVFKLQATVSGPVRRTIVEAPAPRAAAPKAVARKPAPRKPEPAFADGDWQEF
jgi:Methyl-accepting chemotaxis protein (MCP) signaling domain.